MVNQVYRKNIYKKSSSIVTLFAILLLVLSCEKYLDMEITDTGRKPVVNAVFIADTFPVVKVFESKHILDNTHYKNISNAQVNIIVDGQLWSLTYDTIKRIYTDTSLRISSQSNVIVNVDTYLGKAEGTTTVPIHVPILSCDTFPHFDKNGNYDGVELRLRFKDIANVHNYYMITFHSNSLYPTFDAYNEPGLEYINEKIFLDDFAFDGKIKTLKFFVYRYAGKYMNYNGIIEFYLFHLDESLYKYQLSLQKQINTGNSPFSEPVMVYNNIKNGYGICGSASYFKFKLEL